MAIINQAPIPMPDYIYQQPQSQMGAMPDYIYQQPQSQMGVETQAPPSAVPPVFMPSPTDIAAQNFYSSQESLVSQPPTPINYGQAPASGYRPGIDPPIQHVFDRVSTISPTADESGDIDEPLIDPSSIIPANQPVFFSPGGHGGQSKGTQGQTLGDTVFMRDGGMPKHAQQLAERGRYGDTTLVHMNPKEMAGIASLFPDQTITRNPDTGLPEMFDFMSILPTIAGIGASFFLGPVGAAAVSGITTAITTKDVGKGVMAGLMSYGLGSLMGAGSESATQAATAADAAVQAGTSAGTDAATQAAITSGQLAPNVSVGPGVGPGVGPAGAIDVSALTGTNLAGPTALDISALSGTNPSSPAMQGLPGTADAFKPALSGEGSMFNEIYSPSRSGMLSEKQFMDPYFRPGASVDPSPQSVAGPPVSFNASPASFSADEIPSNALRSEGGILEGSRQKISDTAEMLTDRTYFDLADTPGYTAEGGDDAARALGFRSVGDLAGPAMYAGMGAYGTIAPMLEPDPYEYQPPEKRSYGSVRAIPESEYRVPSSAPVGYDPTTQGEWSYYGNEGGIVRNLPTIYAKSGYGGNQAAAALQEVIAGNAPRTPLQSQGMGNNPPSQAAPPQAVKSSFNPQNVLQLMGKYMPSAYAAEGGLGKTAEALALGAGIGATETIPDHVISEAIETAKKYGATDEEINKTPTSKLPDLARQYKSMSTEGSPIVTDRVTGKEYTGAPPIEKQAGGIAGVIEEEIPMGAEEVATIGIMEGAPEAIQDGVRDEAMLNEPSDPQNAEERAIYDRAILALGGELEPSTAQKAIDEYIEVFGAQAYRALKKMVNQPREAGGIVKPANGETTVPNGELQGEDIIAGKIVDSVTGQEKANLRVAENEYIKTGQDLSNQALANGLPPTPENGAMVEGMEEEALRRAFG